MATEKGSRLAFSCWLLPHSLQAERSWESVSRIRHLPDFGLGCVGMSCPQRRKALLVGHLSTLGYAARRYLPTGNQGRNWSWLFFFFFFFSLAAAYAFLPPLGKLALAAERGKVSKFNLKYALEVIFGGSQDWKWLKADQNQLPGINFQRLYG